MSSDNRNLTAIPFRGDTIIAIETPEGIYTPLKPRCEVLGLDFSRQLKRVKAVPERWRGGLMPIPSGSGTQETYCLPLTKLHGWVCGVAANKVKPEFRDRLIAYQNELDDVLYAHFQKLHEDETEEIRQLRGQLSHCHANLRAALPKWGQIIALLETGCFASPSMAARVNWSQARLWDEHDAITRCGMLLPEGVKANTAESWLERIAFLERMVQSERTQRMADARGVTVAAYLRGETEPDQPSLFGEA